MQTTESHHGAPAKRGTASPTIRSHLEGPAFKEAIRQALPKHLSADRFVRVALTAITRTPKLVQCDQASFFQCLLTLSQFGLEPDGRRAHLIPFENRKRGVTECQLIIDYKGLVELVNRSGIVSFIHADVVCDNDEFEYDRGEIKKHRINLREPRGNVYAVYALCRFKDGGEKSEVMSRQEVETIRARSRAGNSGPWVTDWNEMAKKSAFRRLSKWLPLSAEFRDAEEADADALTDARTAATPSIDGAGMFEDLPPGKPVGEESPAPGDEDAEAEAGLAPARSAASEPTIVPRQSSASTSSEPKGEPKFSPQEQLAKLCIEEGFNFDIFRKWAIVTGNFVVKKKPDDVNSFDDLEPELCSRLIRAKTGLINGLNQVMGGGK